GLLASANATHTTTSPVVSHCRHRRGLRGRPSRQNGSQETGNNGDPENDRDVTHWERPAHTWPNGITENYCRAGIAVDEPEKHTYNRANAGDEHRLDRKHCA